MTEQTPQTNTPPICGWDPDTHSCHICGAFGLFTLVADCKKEKWIRARNLGLKPLDE